MPKSSLILAATGLLLLGGCTDLPKCWSKRDSFEINDHSMTLEFWYRENVWIVDRTCDDKLLPLLTRDLEMMDKLERFSDKNLKEGDFKERAQLKVSGRISKSATGEKIFEITKLGD